MIIELQQGQPQLYNSITTTLDADQQAVVQSVLVQADRNAQQALLAAQQAALAGAPTS